MMNEVTLFKVLYSLTLSPLEVTAYCSLCNSESDAETVSCSIVDLFRQHSHTQIRAVSSVLKHRPQQDRKSVVEGKSVSVRVGLGGRRILKYIPKSYHVNR